MIPRKYWDHLRDKIILGRFAYLKFPPFHGLVKLAPVLTVSNQYVAPILTLSSHLPENTLFSEDKYSLYPIVLSQVV